ncbi:MAG TPA: ABC transporter ATP-binding protein, partial [Tepiditoga sp.]|nr:ABC transporter ATP-binding protein [Tepiditoga sp.]
ISITGAVFSLVHPMSWTFSDNVKKLVRDMNYMNDYNKFISLPETELKNSNENLYEKPETISFRNVSFKYPGNVNYVLKNFSLELKKNKSYAFVGANGAGKSTVIKLLLGIYEDYTGDILINGKNQKNIPREQWYRYFSVVFQDFSKYQISVKNNITMGKPAENKIQKIAEISGVSEILETLPEKENTVLGYTKNGHDLSGGQWQRTAIARGVYRNYDFIVLDEPTAAIDPIAENDMYERFSELGNDGIFFVVTHRLASVKYCNKIILMEKGKILCSGSHEELLKKSEKYYEMWTSQASMYI